MTTVLDEGVAAGRTGGRPSPAPLWSDSLHCLARISPPPANLSRTWCEALADDLTDGRELELDIAAALLLAAEWQRPMATNRWSEYSRLFLCRRCRVTLNTGIYLEGGWLASARR
jgi:hypothetical protein